MWDEWDWIEFGIEWVPVIVARNDWKYPEDRIFDYLENPNKRGNAAIEEDSSVEESTSP